MRRFMYDKELLVEKCTDDKNKLLEQVLLNNFYVVQSRDWNTIK